MTKASIIENGDASFLLVLPRRGHPIPPPIFSLLHKIHTDMHIAIFLTERSISSLTSAYPPSLLQVSL